MIASLAMYDRPETASATDRLWQAIRKRLRAAGIDAPQTLNRTTPFLETWQRDDLVFSQTCGRPFRLLLHDKVTLVGTPDYGHQGCPPGYYRSAFIVRARDPKTAITDFHHARFAYNETLSQSGWAAPQCHVAAQGFQFNTTIKTGGHVNSARAVAENEADIAAIDALSWDLIKRYEGFSLDLRVLGWTSPTPGLPYITSTALLQDIIFNAVSGAIDSLDLNDRRTLRLKGLVKIPAADYLAVPNP